MSRFCLALALTIAPAIPSCSMAGAPDGTSRDDGDAPDVQIESGTTSTFTKTRYPIVLAHGLSGFRQLFGVVDYTAARTAALGADAAARLAELDRAHAAWDAKLARFRGERAAVLADPRLDDAERGRRIDDLLARSFTAAARIRVEALDHMAPAPGAR